MRTNRYQNRDKSHLRIAIASSGLGHISRGIETWAEDSAGAHHHYGQDVTLFQGSGEAKAPWAQVVPCRRRFDAQTQQLVQRFKRLGGWRYGCGSGYEIEQTTFALRLWPRIRDDYDILHLQDSHVALIMELLHRRGLSRPRVILAHGTSESASFLRRFSNLQHLAPCYLEDWKQHQPARQRAFAIPNFVDITTFQPLDRAAARKRWNIPEDHLVILCVAAIKKGHKRIDYLLREFAEFSASAGQPATLVVAGAREQDTEEIMAEGSALLGDRVRFLVSVPRADVPSLYQAADVFTIASLREMMPIAVLEALACGLPVTCNDTPTLSWMAGPAACPNDISGKGALAAQFRSLLDRQCREGRGRLARLHAESTFSSAVVVPQMLDMYRQVL